MNNPYESPAAAKSAATDVTPSGLPMQPERGLVGHVRIISILMFVQAGLELLMGAYFVVFGVIYPMLMQSMMGEELARRPRSGPPPETMLWMIGGMMSVFGAALLIVAGVRIYAGWRNYRFRGRTLGIVSLALGIATVMTCYCAPTAIALACYGLIVYLNPQVALAFQFGERGHSGDNILASFPSS